MANINRWQFSLRALLILTALVAAVTALAASHPGVALLIVLGTTYVLFESGAIVEIVVYLAKPHVFARHPLLATVVWIVVGLISFAISSCFVWMLLHSKEVGSILGLLLAAILCGGFGSYCGWLLWKSFKMPVGTPPTETVDQLPH
ncbi:MAG: hypothetical protein WD971_05655 [Pirellulales bacterium]